MYFCVYSVLIILPYDKFGPHFLGLSECERNQKIQKLANNLTSKEHLNNYRNSNTHVYISVK
jgi:hypothetical protein